MAACGLGARRRYRAKKREMKKAAAKQVERPSAELSVPTITEADLLAFQLSHFGDDSKPHDWFVDPETALHFQPEWEEEGEEDELGYYEDGVKRTITDEQIAMFRHSEIQQLLRERRLRQEEEEYQDGGPEEGECNDDGTTGEAPRAPSPTSDVSSLEDDLLGLAHAVRRPSQQRQPSQSTESTTSRPSNPKPSKRSKKKKKKRQEEVPYEQRHKRKWEGYVEDEDLVEGSLTHRRIVRELDEVKVQRVEMDY